MTGITRIIKPLIFLSVSSVSSVVKWHFGDCSKARADLDALPAAGGMLKSNVFRGDAEQEAARKPEKPTGRSRGLRCVGEAFTLMLLSRAEEASCPKVRRSARQAAMCWVPGFHELCNRSRSSSDGGAAAAADLAAECPAAVSEPGRAAGWAGAARAAGRRAARPGRRRWSGPGRAGQPGTRKVCHAWRKLPNLTGAGGVVTSVIGSPSRQNH